MVQGSPEPNIQNNSIFIFHYSLKNESKYLSITSKRVCVFFIRNSDSFVVTICPKIKLFFI